MVLIKIYGVFSSLYDSINDLTDSYVETFETLSSEIINISLSDL